VIEKISMDKVALARFEKFLDTTGECWIWSGSCVRSGYGQFLFEGKVWQTHRLMYLHCYGELPEEPLVVRHKCKHRNCCNPDHLEPGTMSENHLDKHRDGTMVQAKLTVEQVLEIRKRSNERHCDLAREFGVKQNTISSIINRKNWSHI